MQIRGHVGLSGIAAARIREAREGGLSGNRPLSRREMADELNRRGLPPGDPPRSGDDLEADDRPYWDHSAVVRLEHAAGTPKQKPIPVDDLLSVCETLDVTLFDLLLPETEDARRYNRISRALFGFYATPEMLEALRQQARWIEALRFHPDVVEALRRTEVAQVRSMVEQNIDAYDAALLDHDRIIRRRVFDMTTEIHQGKRPAPTDEDLDRWQEGYLATRYDDLEAAGLLAPADDHEDGTNAA